MPRTVLPWTPLGRKIASQNAKRRRLMRKGIAPVGGKATMRALIERAMAELARKP